MALPELPALHGGSRPAEVAPARRARLADGRASSACRAATGFFSRNSGAASISISGPMEGGIVSARRDVDSKRRMAESWRTCVPSGRRPNMAILMRTRRSLAQPARPGSACARRAVKNAYLTGVRTPSARKKRRSGPISLEEASSPRSTPRPVREQPWPSPHDAVGRVHKVPKSTSAARRCAAPAVEHLGPAGRRRPWPNRQRRRAYSGAGGSGCAPAHRDQHGRQLAVRAQRHSNARAGISGRSRRIGAQAPRRSPAPTTATLSRLSRKARAHTRIRRPRSPARAPASSQRSRKRALEAIRRRRCAQQQSNSAAPST